MLHKIQTGSLLTGAVAALTILSSFGCKRIVFEQYRTVSPAGWHYNDTMAFHAEVDAGDPYNISLMLQNSDSYPYANIWVALKWVSPTGDTVSRMINMPLAESSGRWIGTGPGDIYDSQMPIEKNFSFTEGGEYTFLVSHMMRDDNLKGIRETGIRLKKQGS